MNYQDYKSIGVIRTAAILTTSYVAATVIKDAQNYNQLILYFVYAKGSLDSFQIKLDFSDDGGTTLYQETFEGISSGTATESAGLHTFAPSGDQNFVLATAIKYPYIKVSAKGTGTVTSSSLQIRAALGIQ